MLGSGDRLVGVRILSVVPSVSVLKRLQEELLA